MSEEREYRVAAYLMTTDAELGEVRRPEVLIGRVGQREVEVGVHPGPSIVWNAVDAASGHAGHDWPTTDRQSARTATLARGLTTVVVLHNLNAAAQFADRIVMMHAGRVVGQGSPTEALTKETLRMCYQVEAAVFAGPDGAPIILPLRPHHAEAHL